MTTTSPTSTFRTHEIPPIDDTSPDDTLRVLTEAQTRFLHLPVIAFRPNCRSGMWQLHDLIVRSRVD